MYLTILKKSHQLSENFMGTGSWEQCHNDKSRVSEAPQAVGQLFEQLGDVVSHARTPFQSLEQIPVEHLR